MSKSALKRTMSIAALMVASMFSGQANAMDWNGAHFGVSAGSASVDDEATTSTVFSPTGYFATTSVTAIATAGAQNMSGSTIAFGADFGIDHRIGNLVLGAGIDWSTFGMSDSVTSGAVYPCCAPTAFSIYQDFETKWLATAKLRAGWVFPSAIGDRDLLVYVTGGMASTKVRTTTVFTDTFATARETAEKSVNARGMVWGVGAELQLGEHMTVRPEWEHVDIGQVSPRSSGLTAFTPAISFPTSQFTHHQDFEADVIRVGLVFHH